MTGRLSQAGCVRGVAVVTATLVLLSTTLATPVAAQSNGNTNSDPCSGLPVGANWICDGLLGFVEWFIGGLGDIAQSMMVGVVEFIVNTPAPYSNGDMALLESPDNPPRDSLHQLYLTKTLPIGLALWALIALLTQVTRIFTQTIATEAQRTRLTRRAAFSLLLLIAWWPVGAFVLHMADSLTTTIAPTGQQMVGTINEFFANVGGGLIAATLIYFSSGFLAILLLILFLTRYVAIYVLMPLMPILIALWIVDEGPMKYIAGVAESIGGLFVPFVFMTLPTAAILLVGYTIQDALRQSLGSITILPGISGAATTAYTMILFVFWVMALIAPLLVLFGDRTGMSMLTLTAGYFAGRSLSGVSVRGSRSQETPAGAGSQESGSASTRNSGTVSDVPASTTAGPIRTPASLGTDTPENHSTDSGPGPDPSLGATSGDAAVHAGSVSEPKSPPTSPATPWSDLSGGIDDSHVQARVTPESGFDERLPDDRVYTFGYSRGGEFGAISQQRNLDKSDVVNRKYPRLSDSALYADKSDMYLKDDQGDLYDVTPLWEYDQRHEQFDRRAREVVHAARTYGSDATAMAEHTRSP